MRKKIKKVIFSILFYFLKNYQFIFIKPSFLGGLLNLLYIKSINKNVQIIIDPIELAINNKNINFLIFKIACKELSGKNLNYFLNLIFYIYYRSALYTKDLEKIIFKSFSHRDKNVYKSLSNQNNIYFDYKNKVKNQDIKNLISKKFIIFHCRDGAYKKNTSKMNLNYHNYRNEKLITYENALSKLDKNHELVRFGSVSEQKCVNKKIFDYTNSKIRNEKNDLLLMKKCDLYVGTGSGPDVLAMNFQRPIVYVNWLRIPDLFTFQNNVVVIFKKIFDEKKNKFINFNKLLDLNFKLNNEKIPVPLFEETVQYERNNLKVIDNTEDEIFHAVKEMLDFLDGKFSFNEELQLNFKKNFIKSTGNKFSENFFVSENFLIKNKELFN